MTNIETILTIEDDAPMRRLLSMSLSVSGFNVLEAANGKDGMLMAASYVPSAIILDMGLPDIDGMTVIKELRTWYNRPIIVLSAMVMEDDIVRALEAGVNDYVCKPFLARELAVRIKKAIYYTRFDTEERKILEVGNISIDIAGHTVTKGGIRVDLTHTEFSLLYLFARNSGRVLTHRLIMDEIWGKHVYDTQSLRVFVSSIRKKIEDNPSKPTLLRTESGIGYRFG
jgi:two-component system KDP operon response regulator KdpE